MTGALRVGIMGAGRMAQGFDAPGDRHVLSLAHAVTRCDGMTLGGFFDLDPAGAARAESRWGVPETPRARDAWLDADWDVIAIATPDSCHRDDLCDVLARRPGAVIVEKPLATDSRQAGELLGRAGELGIPVFVNFPRRHHSGVAEAGTAMGAGRLGRPLAAQFAYSGAPEHSAVHMLDLFHQWWGGEWSVRPAGSSDETVLLTFQRADECIAASFCRLPSDPYYLWEMSVLCEAGKVALTRSPEVLEVSTPAPHPLYETFSVLTPAMTFDMESEPLLSRLMDAVAATVGDQKKISDQLAREQASQQFSGAVLDQLVCATPSAQRAAS
jgi:hypothetical protein